MKDQLIPLTATLYIRHIKNGRKVFVSFVEKCEDTFGNTYFSETMRHQLTDKSINVKHCYMEAIINKLLKEK